MDPRLAAQQDHVPSGGFINMQQAVLVPLPDNFSNPQLILNREERLKTMISNLKTHHGQVRNSILSQALTAQQMIQARDTSTDPLISPTILHQINQVAIVALNTTRDPDDSPPPPPKASSTHSNWSLGSNPYMTITAQLHIALLTETEQKLKAYDTHAQKTIEYYQNALDRGLGDSGTKVDWKADAGLRSGDTTPSLPQGDIGQRKEQDEYTKNMIEYYQKALKERALAEVGAKGDSGSRSGDTTPVLAQGDAGQRKIVTFAADSAPGDGKGQAFGVGGGQRPGEIARIGSYDASRDPRLR